MFEPTTSGENPLLDGTAGAWERLTAAIHIPSLLVVVESRMSAFLRSRLAPEDILQDAFAHAWRDRASFRWQGVGSFRAWMLGIIDHRIQDAAAREGALKRGGARAAGPLDDRPPPEACHSTTASRLAIHREAVEAMKEALASLPPDLETVVRLRLFEQIPTEQIALRLGIGHAAVRHRLRRGSLLYREAVRARLASRSRPSTQN